MLLTEITNVVDINSRRKKQQKAEKEVEIPDTIGAPKSDAVSNKRRSKMSPSDQLRDVARQLRNK